MNVLTITSLSRLVKAAICIGFCCSVVFLLPGCCSSRSILISDSNEFRDLIGSIDELAGDCGLFVEKGSEKLSLVSMSDEENRSLVRIIPKGTKVKLVSVYRQEYYRIDGKVYLTAEFPTLEIEVEGHKYKDVEAYFTMLKKNKNVSSARPAPHISK